MRVTFELFGNDGPDDVERTTVQLEVVPQPGQAVRFAGEVYTVSEVCFDVNENAAGRVVARAWA